MKDSDKLDCLEDKSTWLRALRGSVDSALTAERAAMSTTVALLLPNYATLSTRLSNKLSEEFSVELEALNKGKTLPNNSDLLPLTPFLDSNGLLRVGGRLVGSQLACTAKHQLILPARYDVTRLVVADKHRKLAQCANRPRPSHLRQR